MKTMKYFMMALVCLLMQSATCLADGRPIPVEQLPKAAKDFVAKYFPGQNIIYAEKEYGKYEARFNNGTEIEFDKKGNWDKVDCKTTAVPAALIPEAIVQYVQANFAGAVITKIDKERYGYEIELSNDIDLKFNKQGALIGMDD